MIQGTLPLPFDHHLRFFLRLFRFSDQSLGLHRFLSPLVALLSPSFIAPFFAPLPLLHSETFASDPWKVLIATIFLNVTHGTQSIPIIHALLEIWNTPEKMAEASPDEIYPCIRHLGLGHSRSKRIVDLSRAWIARPLSFNDKSVSSKSDDRAKDESIPVKGNRNCLLTHIFHLPGVGRYALDSFRTFCTTSDEWKNVRPTDKELIRFLAWKWAYREHHRWHPERGPMGYADAAYVERLITNLAVTTPGMPKSPQ
ncbi:DNA glycosylase [Schizophyllum commune]